MTLDEKFPAKRAFITGAASGLGLAICERLAAQGWNLLLADINGTRLASTTHKLREEGANVLSEIMDVTEYSSLEQAAATVEREWGGVDLVFNNAGIAAAGAMEEISLAEWGNVLAVDLWSVIYGCKAFLPLLKRQGRGHIINTASSAGTLAGPEMAAYNVAKAGVVSLSETLRVELSNQQIGVTVICPTVFVTSLGESLKGNRDMERKLLMQLERSRVSADAIVDDVVAAILRDRLYVMTQHDAKWGWRLKRYFPELYTRLMANLYRNKKWIFAEAES